MTATSAKDSTTMSRENGCELKTFASLDAEKSQAASEPSNDGVTISVGVEMIEHRGRCTRFVETVEEVLGRFYDQNKQLIVVGFKVFLLLLYGAYFGYAMYYRFGDEGSIILLVGTVLLVIYLVRKLLLSGGCKCGVPKSFHEFITSKSGRRLRTVIRYGLYAIATTALGLFLGLDVLQSHPRNSQSLLGIAVLITIGYLISTKPSRVNWHPIFWGFIIQFVFAIITIRTQAGYDAFKWLGNAVQTLVHFSDKGSAFVLDKNFKSMGLAFSSSGVIIFFNSLIFLLNHLGVLDVLISRAGSFLGWCLDTGPVESVVAAANVFIGLAEAPLLVRPYLPKLSRSEVCAVMTCGFASVSGGIMGLFILAGAPANHLLTAAIISAPAALVFTKLVCPETETVDTAMQKNVSTKDPSNHSKNVLSALSEGAVVAVTVVASVWANMLAFVSLLGLIDAVLDWLGQRVGIKGLTFNMLCFYILYPLSYVMGVEPADCGMVGSLIGVKLFATPVVGFSDLGDIIKNRKVLEQYINDGTGTWHWSGSDIFLDAFNTTLVNGVMSERSEVIATYAMCGFSAFTAIGICLGSLTALCPSRKSDIVQLVLRAFIAGNMASFATGAVAGLMHSGK